MSGITEVEFLSTELDEESGLELLLRVTVDGDGGGFSATIRTLLVKEYDNDLGMQAVWVTGSDDTTVITYSLDTEPQPNGVLRYIGHRFTPEGDDSWENGNPVLLDDTFGFWPMAPWIWPLSDGSLLLSVNKQTSLIDAGGVRLFHITPDGHVSSQSSVGQEIQTTQFVLANPCPNPFNSTTRIEYVLPHAMGIEVSVYDLMGRQIMCLEKGMKSAGRHNVVFDSGKMLAGSPVSGVYFIQLKSGAGIQTRKLVLLK